MSKLPFVPGNVMIDYTNHAGFRAVREIVPMSSNAIYFGWTQWHPEPQWLLDAHDVAKDKLRIFAMKDIHAWAPKDTASGRVIEGVFKQLQRSMEFRSRMVARLKQLQAACESHQTYDASRAIEAILKDEDF